MIRVRRILKKIQILRIQSHQRVNEEKPKSYVDVLKRSIKNERKKKKENDVLEKPDLPHKYKKDKFRRPFHQGGITQLSTRTPSLVIAFLAISFAINQ